MDIKLPLDKHQNNDNYKTNISTIENCITIDILNIDTNSKYELVITQDGELWQKYKPFFQNFSEIFDLLRKTFDINDNTQDWSIISETSEELYIDINVEGVFGFNFIISILKEKEENSHLYRLIYKLEEKMRIMEQKLNKLENS
jgi:hypothetical protein